MLSVGVCGSNLDLKILVHGGFSDACVSQPEHAWAGVVPLCGEPTGSPRLLLMVTPLVYPCLCLEAQRELLM